MQRQRSPLQQACWDGDVEAALAIVTGNASVSELDLDDALYIAISQRHPEVINALLDSRALISEAALCRVCSICDVRIVKQFLDHGRNPNTQFAWGEPPIRLLVKDKECIKLMLERGADPNLVGQRGPLPHQRGYTALVTALGSCETLDVVELLISYGAILNPEYLYEALNPFATATETMTTYLLQHGVSVQTHSDRWSTPLHFAVYQRSLSKVQLLLDAGADPLAAATGRNYTGLTPVQLAEQKGYLDIRDVLLEASERLVNGHS